MRDGPPRAAAPRPGSQFIPPPPGSDGGDDYEDLDELQSEEDEPLSSAAQRKKAAGKKGLLSGALNKPRHVSLNCKQLHQMIHHGQVDLNPSYQRDVVWPHSKMCGLIESLFLNYYIPPIIFAMSIDETTGEEKRTSIDGKQRCTSILRFIDGEVPYIAPDKTKYYYRLGEGVPRTAKELPPALKTRFDMISLVIVEYDDISDDVQRDIFQRVQLGVALSSAEKLQAIASPWSTWISDMLKRYVFEPNTLETLMTWDVSRGKPFQAFTAIAIWCQDQSKIAALSSTDFRKFLDRQDAPEPHYRRRVEKTMSLLVNIAASYHDVVFDLGTIHGRATKVVAPVEIWFIGYIIYTRMNESSIAGLAQTCGAMRKWVRTTFKDRFTNTLTISAIHKWLQSKDAPVIRPGPGETVAAAEWETDDPDRAYVVSKKRRREALEDAADPDYTGGPIARGTRSDVVEGTRSRTAGNGTAPKSPTKHKANGSATAAAAGAVKREPGTAEPSVAPLSARSLPTPAAAATQGGYVGNSLPPMQPLGKSAMQQNHSPVIGASPFASHGTVPMQNNQYAGSSQQQPQQWTAQQLQQLRQQQYAQQIQAQQYRQQSAAYHAQPGQQGAAYHAPNQRP